MSVNDMRYALVMALNELKPRLYALLLTVLFSAMLGYICGKSVATAIEGRMAIADLYTTFYPDLVLLAMLPTLGALSVSKEYLSWSMLADEPFLKRLSFYRMWPIPVKVVAWSRMFHMLICFAATMTAFLYMFVQVSWPAFSELINIWQYIVYLLMWVGYALAINGIHPFFEFGAKGTTLAVVAMVIIVLMVGLVSLLHYALGKPIYVSMIEAVQHSLVLPSVISILVGLIGVGVFQQSLTRRLLKRDFS
ncbi:hypothetical protein ACFOQM_02375 [Paenibacillus sp. GCM10012307]|uniref:Uncharacterized protein n=1 Tax=Paenibacillus roseus TaxID=2798579 RepID=A0A934MTK9_9BACL|nr:hypothetical protein [Paenibacillus roseus]MBJ6360162.1 hypothetical protein [Paenibacillus roseus]